MLKRKRTQRRVRRQRGGDSSTTMPADYPGSRIDARQDPMDPIDSLPVPQRLNHFIEKSDASMDTPAGTTA
jgi:hypothetical protein